MAGETYKISLVVEGQDKASGPLNSVSGALGNIGQIMAGILGSRLLMGIVEGIRDMAFEAVDAVAKMQSLEVGLTTLAAAELINTKQATTFNEALVAAGPIAAKTLEWMRELSLRSPFSYEDIAKSYTFFNSFGLGTELAKTATDATIDYASAVGLTNAEFDRLSYALAQTAAFGKINALDIRQFANNRFGIAQLNAVFEILSKNTGTSVKNYEEFNAAVASGTIKVDDFFTAFSQYTKTTFADAGERMLKTFNGIKSNLEDIKFFSFVDMFSEAGDVIAEFLLPYIDRVLKSLGSGTLKEWGSDFAKSVEGALPLLTAIADTVLLFMEGFDSDKLLTIWDDFIPPEILEQVSLLFGNFSASLDDLAGAGAQATPFLTTLKEFFGAALLETLKLINQYWDLFVIGFVTLGAVLAGGAVISALTAIGAALAAINWPIVLIVAGIALLTYAWQENWFGIQEIMAGVWAWLQPILADLWTWLSTNIPIAIASLSAFWTDTLLPAIMGVWSWLSTTLFPFLEALRNFISASFEVALTAFAGVWQNVLQPALEDVFIVLSNNLMPVFRALSAWWEETGRPIVEAMADWFGNILVAAFEGLNETLEKATKWLNDMATKLRTMKLPDWMTPGSPTPWEIGLLGVNAAMKKVANVQLPALNMSLGETAKIVPNIPVPGYGGLSGGSSGLSAASAPAVYVTINSAINTADQLAVRDIMSPIIREEYRSMQNG